MEPQELRLEILKIATREDVCHGSTDNAVKAAEEFLRFVQSGTAGLSIGQAVFRSTQSEGTPSKP
jgi:hypothetical protein